MRHPAWQAVLPSMVCIRRFLVRTRLLVAMLLAFAGACDRGPLRGEGAPCDQENLCGPWFVCVAGACRAQPPDAAPRADADENGTDVEPNQTDAPSTPSGDAGDASPGADAAKPSDARPLTTDALRDAETIDTALAPVELTIVRPAAGAYVTGPFEVEVTLGSPIAGPHKIEVFVDGKLAATRDRSPYVVTVDIADLTSGPHGLEARLSPWTGKATVQVIVDRAPPVIAWKRPQAGAYLAPDTEVALEVTDDVGAASVEATLEQLVTGAEPKVVATWTQLSTSAPSFKVDSSKLAPGAYRLVVRAKDLAGRTALSMISVAVPAPAGEACTNDEGCTSGVCLGGRCCKDAACTPEVAWTTHVVDDTLQFAITPAVAPEGVPYVGVTVLGEGRFGDVARGRVLRSWGPNDGLAARLDDTGNPDWVAQIGSDAWDGIGAYGVAVDGQGNLFMLGTVTLPADLDPTSGVDFRSTPGYHSYVVKISAKGVYEWGQVFPCGNGYGAFFLTAGPEGEALALMTIPGQVDLDPGPGVDLRSEANGSLYLIKLAADGKYRWARQIVGVRRGVGLPHVAVSVGADGAVGYAGIFPAPVDLDPTSGVDERQPPPVGVGVAAVRLDKNGGYLGAWTATAAGDAFTDVVLESGQDGYWAISSTKAITHGGKTYNDAVNDRYKGLLVRHEAEQVAWVRPFAGTASVYVQAIAAGYPDGVAAVAALGGTGEVDLDPETEKGTINVPPRTQLGSAVFRLTKKGALSWVRVGEGLIMGIGSSPRGYVVLGYGGFSTVSTEYDLSLDPKKPVVVTIPAGTTDWWMAKLVP